MHRFIVVNNIPTPYRVHLFEAMNRECQHTGIRFEVWFMAKTEPGRFWDFDYESWTFPWRMLPGWQLRLKSISFHINPTAPLHVWREPPTWLMMGGGWHIPTVLGLQLLKKSSSQMLLWAEANQHTSRFKQGLPARYRKWMMERADALVIPGQIARDTIQDFWQIRAKRYIHLPNLVRDQFFYQQSQQLRPHSDNLRAKHKIKDDHHVLFWSARLEEYKKGIINFLNVVKSYPFTILLAGDGRDRNLVKDWQKQHPRFDLRLLGHLRQDDMLPYMMMSDVAILPSFQDPNPVSVIEAMWAGMPILTSVNCGNWPETLVPGENGWLIDPSDPESIRLAVKDILSRSRQEIQTMGQKSLQLAQERFDTQASVQAFISDIIFHLPGRL